MQGDEVEVELEPVPSRTAPAVTFDDVFADELVPMTALATLLCDSRAVADDVVADAFARLLLRFDRVDRPCADLRRNVVKGCTGWRRRSRREQTSDDGDRPDGATDLERAELADALATLPPRQRAAIVLRHWAGLSEAEAAHALDCRPGTVSSLTHRGLAALRIELQEDGG